jgi:hypothetical protein
MAAKTSAFSIPTDLVDSIAASRCVLFVGAGLSKHAKGFPTWDELIDQLRGILPQETKDYIGIDDAHSFKLEFLEYVQKEYPLLFEQSLANTLKVRSSSTSRPHESIARMSFSAIITMNLDTLLEDAFDRLSRDPIVIETDDDIVRLAPKDGVPIFKMHGSFDRKEFRVLSLRDYERFDSTRRTMKAILLSYITQYPMLVIGAGLSDPNFLKLNGIVNQVHGGFKNQVFYLHPGLPAFVKTTWGARRFQFIECEYSAITDWLVDLAHRVDEARQRMSENRGPYFVNRFLKERALEALGSLIDDYDALQREYTASIHMRDYGWFSKSWEETLYSPLSVMLDHNLAELGPVRPSLIYVAPGPHAPVLSKPPRTKLSRLVLSDIDETALAQAHQKLSGSTFADRVQVAPIDLTCGAGREFSQTLSGTVGLPVSDALSLIAEVPWLENRFRDQMSRLDEFIRPIQMETTSVFDIAYSEMVAAFTVTPVLLAFRSRLYQEVKRNRYSEEEADEILRAAVHLWRRYNFLFYKFHLAMLSALLRPGGIVVIAMDTTKIYDDFRTEPEPTFLKDPGTIDTHELTVVVRSNKKLFWRDHDYGFTTYIHGLAIPDFRPHRHEISVITYVKGDSPSYAGETGSSE